MINITRLYCFFLVVLILPGISCGKKDTPAPPPVVKNPIFASATINGIALDNTVYGVNTQPVIRLNFTEALLQSTIASTIRE